MKLFDVVSRALESAERVSELVSRNVRPGAAPRRKLDHIPDPPAPPEPFAKVGTTGAPAEPKALGNPEIAAQIFGRRSCVWCGRAVSLLQTQGIDYRFINLDDPKHEPLQTELIRETRQYTVPYVYLRGEFVGGYDQLAEIDRSGQLAARTTA
jgi:glutaredoxin 3